MNVEEGCQFRFVMKDPKGIGWSSKNRIEITVVDVDYGSVTLPWGTPYKEEIVLLPSGEVNFFWIGPFSAGSHCFEIFNSYGKLIYESPMSFPSEGLFFTYQNECPECTPLTGLVGEYNEETQLVHLSWVVPENEELTGFDIFRNGEWIDHVGSIVNSYTSQTDTLKNGTYKYCVVPVYPFICDLDEECFETYILGIQNHASGLYIYPNPAGDELRIMNYELRIKNVEIFDVFGRNVGNKFPSNLLEGWTRSGRGGKEGCHPQADGVVINISHLPAGVYFVEITTEKGVVTKKVIKQ